MKIEMAIIRAILKINDNVFKGDRDDCGIMVYLHSSFSVLLLSPFISVFLLFPSTYFSSSTYFPFVFRFSLSLLHNLCPTFFPLFLFNLLLFSLFSLLLLAPFSPSHSPFSFPRFLVSCPKLFFLALVSHLSSLPPLPSPIFQSVSLVAKFPLLHFSLFHLPPVHPFSTSFLILSSIPPLIPVIYFLFVSSITHLFNLFLVSFSLLFLIYIHCTSIFSYLFPAS